MTSTSTHLDRLMTQRGLANHQLAAKVGTSRQAIYKLRKGITRMLPDWAKRLAPHLGVPWQELVDGGLSADDQDRAELLAAYDAMDPEERRALLTMARGVVRRERIEEPTRTEPLKPRAGGRASAVPGVGERFQKVPGTA